MKLYQLADDYNQLYDMLEDEDVNIEAIADTLEDIEDEINNKFENISKLVKSLEGQIKVFKDEESRLKNRRTVMENKVKSLKNYMLNQLDFMERTKIQANTFVVRKQKSPKSIEVDQSQLDEKYLIPQDPKPDNDAIKKDLKEGKEVKGAAYKPDSYHLRIQ